MEKRMKIIVLGAGMVGGAIVEDLALDPGFGITAIDLDEGLLNRLEQKSNIRGIQADLSNEETLSSLVTDHDLVISAVPGFMGFETLRRVIEAEKDIVDISFFGEDPFELDALSKSKGVTAVVDCGVAPGLCNIIAGHVHERLDRMDSYVCYVGGLPEEREWPFEYKAVFSPIDVLAEYTRPARFVENGEEVVRPALTDPELIEFPEVGVLEAFNTDGLHTLGRTLDVPFMKEKTLRYPGHAELMRVFRECGFFDEELIEVEGCMVKPIALTSRLFFDKWRATSEDREFTVMQVIIEGRKNNRKIRSTYCLLDRYDEKTKTTSMARTTGYTCSIVARQLLAGMFDNKGICPPEYIGRTAGCFEHLLVEYGKRGIYLKEETVEIDEAHG
jgi:lysine 6-dehydrogenase